MWQYTCNFFHLASLQCLTQHVMKKPICLLFSKSCIKSFSIYINDVSDQICGKMRSPRLNILNTVHRCNLGNVSTPNFDLCYFLCLFPQIVISDSPHTHILLRYEEVLINKRLCRVFTLPILPTTSQFFYKCLDQTTFTFPW